MLTSAAPAEVSRLTRKALSVRGSENKATALAHGTLAERAASPAIGRQHQQPEISGGDAERQPEARQNPARMPSAASSAGLVDLVEHAAVAEMGLLNFGPFPERVGDR